MNKEQNEQNEQPTKILSKANNSCIFEQKPDAVINFAHASQRKRASDTTQYPLRTLSH